MRIRSGLVLLLVLMVSSIVSWGCGGGGGGASGSGEPFPLAPGQGNAPLSFGANQLGQNGGTGIQPPPPPGSPGATHFLQFVVQPSDVNLSVSNLIPDVQVQVTNSAGAPVGGWSVSLQVAPGSVGDALTGQVSATTGAAGIADFSNLQVSGTASGPLELEAVAADANPAFSSSFNIAFAPCPCPAPCGGCVCSGGCCGGGCCGGCGGCGCHVRPHHHRHHHRARTP